MRTRALIPTAAQVTTSCAQMLRPADAVNLVALLSGGRPTACAASADWQQRGSTCGAKLVRLKRARHRAPSGDRRGNYRRRCRGGREHGCARRPA
jgi:hypothetical protein